MTFKMQPTATGISLGGKGYFCLLPTQGLKIERGGFSTRLQLAPVTLSKLFNITHRPFLLGHSGEDSLCHTGLTLICT